MARRARAVRAIVGCALFVTSGVAGGIAARNWFAVPTSLTALASAESSHFHARPQILRVGDAVPAFLSTRFLSVPSRSMPSSSVPSFSIPSSSIPEGGGEMLLPAFPEVLFAGSGHGAAGGTITVDASGHVAQLRDASGHAAESLVLPPERIGSVDGVPRVQREEVPLHRMPALLIDAVLLQEDRRFFEHVGIDPWRIAGAARANLRAGRIVEGGSTITQQLVKNLFLTRTRSLERKLREAHLALWLERRWPKPRILEAYLNHVYLGQDGAVAIHGVGAAARHWFDKDVAELELAECALLAGLLRGPSLYAPDRRPAAALERRNLALRNLRDAGRIDEAAWAEALLAPLGTRLRKPADAHGWFLDGLHRELRDDGELGILADRGLRIITTEDARMQEAAQRVIQEELARLEASFPRLRRSGAPLEAALVALDPHRGDVLALVGGRDRGRSRFHRALHARRQPGSVFKPIVALAALDRAPAFSLDSILLDAPLRIQRPEGPWTPTNYEGRYRGRVTLGEALERSLNVPFVRLGQRLGPAALAAAARRAGVESPMEAVPALALGASEVTLLEMTRAYAVLANGGMRITPRRIQVVVDARSGSVVGEPVRRERAFDGASTHAVARALRFAVQRGTARRLGALGVHAPVAGKTGTTSNERDAWFIGFTSDLVVGVWVGYDDGASIGLPGSRAALPIFAAFLHATGRAHAISSETDPDVPGLAGGLSPRT